jgi:hypothetical protein
VRLTRERKVYVSLFVLGLIALAADRLWLSPKEAAAAESVPETAPPAPAPDPGADAPAPLSFGARLRGRAVWQEGPLREALSAPASWGGVRPEVEVPAPAPVSEFERKHRVSSVLQSKNLAAQGAIVDGHILKRGQALDGFTLVGVEDAKGEQAAVFERDGARVRVVVGDRPELHKADK